jgi:hypothetical protein
MGEMVVHVGGYYGTIGAKEVREGAMRTSRHGTMLCMHDFTAAEVCVPKSKLSCRQGDASLRTENESPLSVRPVRGA